MNVQAEQFVVDAAGNRNAVLIDMERYSELIEAREELESIKAYGNAKAENGAKRGSTARRAERRERMSEFAAEFGGTAIDFDEDLERVGVEHLLTIDEDAE